jgi:hypothetical protein
MMSKNVSAQNDGRRHLSLLKSIYYALEYR